MADLLIKGISDISAPHDIHITNVGLNGVKEAFKAWDSAAGCVYEVVEVPPHGRLIDADELEIRVKSQIQSSFCNQHNATLVFAQGLKLFVENAPTVIEASEDGEQDGKL